MSHDEPTPRKSAAERLPSDPNAVVPVTLNGARLGRPSRREAIQWMMGAMAAASALPAALAPTPARAEPGGQPPRKQEGAATQRAPTTDKGYGVDANLVRIHKPGDLWPLTFDASQKQTAAALADTILPKDAFGPAASTVGVVEMIDEWISSPYTAQQPDKPVVLDGLKWLEAEATKRFGKPFPGLDKAQKRAICDDVCYAKTAKPEFKQAAHFFSRFRTLCASAYYATPEGWQAIGYVGNVPLPSFDGPPPEVLQKLGVTQTVL